MVCQISFTKTACVLYAFICKRAVCTYGSPEQKASLQPLFSGPQGRSLLLHGYMRLGEAYVCRYVCADI
jgi:hypothetical protein